jgi:hypothetical protein
MTDFDYHKFLRDKFGDVDRLVAFLHTYRHDIPRATVNQWFRRASVPADHFATLLMLLEMDVGGPVSLVEYVR